MNWGYPGYITLGILVASPCGSIASAYWRYS